MKNLMTSTLFIFSIMLTLSCCQSKESVTEENPRKPRTIVTTDGEVDDVDSFIRMLLYTNEFEVEGLVISSSQWHYSGDGQGTKFTSEMPNTAQLYGERTELRWPGTDWLPKLIDKYGEVYENLQKHADGYPTPEHLHSMVKVGNIEFEGEMEKDTEGSDWIKSVLLDGDPHPVYLQVWGGTNTIARALKSIEDQYKSSNDWDEIYKKVSDKAIIYTVLDQDATYVKYIAPNWPDVTIIYNADQFWCFAYPWVQRVPDELKPYLSGEFFSKYILNKGPLMAEYYTWGDGRQIHNDPEHYHGNLDSMARFERSKYDFISEGDSPAYFFLLDVGLRSTENPSYGGWGGRFQQSGQIPARYEDGENVTDFNPYTKQHDATYPQTRWIKEQQHDFAARAAWCVEDYENANHAPEVSLNHSKDLTAKKGDTVELRGSAQDPDNDEVSYIWWQFLEVGTFPAMVQITDKNASDASFVIPEDANVGDKIHMLLEVTDKGQPALTRYQRVVVEVIE